MPFAYYRRLNRAQQRIYQRSDEVGGIRLPNHASCADMVDAIAGALETGDRMATENACQRLADAVTLNLKVAPVRVEVMAVRPSRNRGELHGLYTPKEGGRPPTIAVWMRTAQRHQVVAFRTFLRTLSHELCHHLDFELLGLRESFHTVEFYKRESSLVHQLLRKE